MKRGLFGVIGSLFFSLFLFGFVSGAVYINEVELNPLGNDGGNEWVELYNDIGVVDLDGWYLQDSGGDNYSLSGSIDDYYVLDNLDGLVNTNEDLFLFDNLDNVIDFVGGLNDNDNNGDTWQKVPNAAGSLIFKDSTMGTTNEIFKVPEDYASIQVAIDNVIAGSKIVVGEALSPYEEDLIIDVDNLEIVANGVVTIKGVINVDVGDFPLSLANIEIISDGVKLHGFNIESPDFVSSKYSSGVVIGGEDVEIYDNTFITNSVDSIDETSQVIQTYSTSALPGVDVSGLHIHDNIFTHKGLSDWGYEAIYVNPDGENGYINISNNVFEGKLIRAITLERSKAYVEDNIISTILPVIPDDFSSFGSYQGINVRKFDSSNQNNIFIKNNVIGGVSDVDGFNQGLRLGQAGQTFSNIEVSENLIQNNSKGVYVVVENGVLINHNNIFGNVIGLDNEDSSELNAEFNYWGACDGPSGIGSGSGDVIEGNVDFDLFIGLCIENKIEVMCAFENENVTLSAKVNGSFLENVNFTYEVDGVTFNAIGSQVLGTVNNYSYVIDSFELVGGQNVTWNVYAIDEFGNIFVNGEKTFYVRNNTQVVISPPSPDGLNGWYISEPIFSFDFDLFSLETYYRWDSLAEVVYASSFGLEGVPNGKQSGGILDLNYYSEFDCGNESVSTLDLKVDLTGPEIKNLEPANNSIVYNTQRPTIQAFLDEIYGDNSGINKDSVYMKIDGDLNNASINVIDSGDVDAIVSHSPNSDLSEGLHTVMVYTEDHAGLGNFTSWSFVINLTALDFDFIINMPTNVSYDERRIKFSMNTSKEVEKIEYVNYDDRNPRWRRLCRNCDEYGVSRSRKKNLNEGSNNLSFRAIDEFGNNITKNIVLFVDSRAPRISRVLPRRNAVTNGSGFYVKFIENNIERVSVNFNPSFDLDLNSSCASSGRSATECNADLNLTDFNDQYIEYSFNVSDSVSEVMSRETRIFVDTVSPVVSLNMPENITYGRRVPFNISVSEEVKLEYYDAFDSRPRWRRLCGRCSEYGVSRLKKRSFRIGSHDVLIRAIDKAGNSDLARVEFNVV